METKKYSNKRTLRLIIVVLYLLLGLPFQFSLISRHILQTYDLIMMSIIFNIFLFSEIVEYVFLYPSKEKRLVRYTFIIRLFFACFSLIYTYIIKGNIQPFYYNYITLICFYSYFLFGSKKSFIFTICFALLSIFSDFNNFYVNDIDFYYRLLMIIQRLTIIMIFYIFAKFWDDDRKKSIENEILLEELNQSKKELKTYASTIAKSSVLEERTRIARDMHDSIGHSLTAIQIQLRAANAFLDIDNNRSRKSINAALEVAKTSLLDTRSVLNDLRSPEKQFSFKSKLENIINTLEQSGIEVSSNIAPDDEEINYACLLALFRFAQESSTNIIKHSKATYKRYDKNAEKR